MIVPDCCKENAVLRVFRCNVHSELYDLPEMMVKDGKITPECDVFRAQLADANLH